MFLTYDINIKTKNKNCQQECLWSRSSKSGSNSLSCNSTHTQVQDFKMPYHTLAISLHASKLFIPSKFGLLLRHVTLESRRPWILGMKPSWVTLEHSLLAQFTSQGCCGTSSTRHAHHIDLFIKTIKVGF